MGAFHPISKSDNAMIQNGVSRDTAAGPDDGVFHDRAGFDDRGGADDRVFDDGSRFDDRIRMDRGGESEFVVGHQI